MKFALSILVLSCSIALASALAIQPICPVPLTVSSYLPGMPSNFIGNAFHYNRAPNPENSGNPIGPYFRTDASDCSWVPNGQFRCHLFLYSDSATTNQIGDGVLSGTLNMDNTDPKYAYGCLNWKSSFTTLHTIPTYLEAQLANFRNQDETICFRRRVEMSDTNNVPFANLVTNTSNTAILTLWGSNGFNAQTQEFNGQTRFSGFDGRFLLECLTEPPIIVTCPCSDARGLWQYDPDCIQNGVAIEVSSPGACLSLEFNELPNNGNCVPQPLTS